MSNSTNQPDEICIRVFITGSVQGVGYRYSTVQKARQLGIRGWVRNLPDGRVEAVFAGDRAAVEEIVQLCYQGPPAAAVRNVEIEEARDTGSQGFEVR